MSQVLRILGLRLARSYTTMPPLRQWLESLLVLGIFLLIVVPLGLTSGFLTYTPTSDSASSLIVFAAVAFAAPSLYEETLFRALLLPHREEKFTAAGLAGNVLVLVTLFVLAHPLVAWLFVPTAQTLFFDPAFMGLTAIFGLVVSLVYLRTGSIWPCVLIHWTIVFGWKIWFGGWIMFFGPPGP